LEGFLKDSGFTFLLDVGFFILDLSKIQRNKKLTDTDFNSLVFQDWVLKIQYWTGGYSG